MTKMKSEDLVKCEACGDFGIFNDEIHIYELPTENRSFAQLCLDCGPEENYAELAPDA